MPLLVKGGRIVTAADDYPADVYCAGETITRIAETSGENGLLSIAVWVAITHNTCSQWDEAILYPRCGPVLRPDMFEQ